ncbi:heterokaryon incompatibility protein-domain-containing protein [Diaporthe sp. PMI_573]|nr:heterokaryon incompatibility protein-domain-containing protein [Diaporthaceae sp. PMI_573]
MQQCTSRHSKCRAPDLNPELPTRVIDVLASDRGVALFESNGQRGRYTALSHCWGTSSRLMATKKSMDDLKDGIALSFLPETFQDAVKITRRLGIKYLWIDCFCIIQDDRQDWEREAARMAQIYRRSYITIAAAGSTDSYSGCFPKRKDDSYVTPGTRSLGYGVTREASGPKCQVVEYQHASQPQQRNRIHLFNEWMPGSSYFIPQLMDIGSFGKTFDPIADQPLSTRGWTLQERLLPARIIHYANDQMYFECENSILSEDGFIFEDLFYSMSKLLHTQRCPFEAHGLQKMSGLSFVVGQVPNEKSPGVRSQGGWLFLVENFTRRKLTYAQDKLPAIAGVARILAEETNDLYWAGLWASHIYEDLCWRVYTHEENFEHGRNNEPVKGKLIGQATRPAEYRAPSWSWASIEAPVQFSMLSYANLVAEVMDCSVTPAGNDQFGRVSGGKLDILAPIYEITAYEPKNPWDRHGIPVKIDLGDERGVCAGAVYLDMPDEPLQFPCYALFVDPGKALIIKGKELQPYLDANGKDDPNRLVPKGILSTEDVNRYYREPPKGETTVGVKGDENSTDPERRKPRQVTISEENNRELWEYWKDRRKTRVHKATNDAVRIGMGEFVRTRIEDLEREKQEPVKYDTAVQADLKLEDVLHVEGDGSWGPVTDDDQKVLVTVL